MSAAYYALFHKIIGDAVALIAPNVPAETNHRIQRWFDHGEMKRICGRFMSTKLDQPLLGLMGAVPPSDLQTVASIFIQLQDARHSADYDLGFQLSHRDAMIYVIRCTQAIEAWDRIKQSAEANIFILSLLMWKNWDKARL